MVFGVISNEVPKATDPVSEQKEHEKEADNSPDVGAFHVFYEL